MYEEQDNGALIRQVMQRAFRAPQPAPQEGGEEAMFDRLLARLAEDERAGGAASSARGDSLQGR